MKDTILIVDDEESIRVALAGVLEDEGFQTIAAGDGRVALQMLQTEQPDLVLLDIWMPGLDGMEVLQRLKEAHPFLPVVMMSGHGTIETAVKATRMGAYDFIEKPLSLEKVIVTVDNALSMSRLREENRSLRSLISRDQSLVGDTRRMRELKEEIRQAAGSEAPVLISGESGVGKKLAARNIHLSGPRRQQPLEELNCMGMPEELLVGELFGYEKGALPGAISRKKGLIEEADGGTLVLAGADTLTPATQTRLLRFIREGVFERCGGNRHLSANVRIIATRGHEGAPPDPGGLMEEFYYALSVISLAVPPLRERKEDIPALVEQLLSLYSRREGKGLKRLDASALELLTRYEWPGNVRELKNIVERLVIMTSTEIIMPEHLPLFLRPVTTPTVPAAPAPTSLREARESFEREYIAGALERCGWDVSRAAERLDLERSILFRKIKGYGIAVPIEEGM